MNQSITSPDLVVLLRREFPVGGAGDSVDEERDSTRPIEGGNATSVIVGTREILERVGPPVLRVVQSILGSSHPDVDDVLQEALLGFMQSLHHFRGESGLVHYACRIAIRHAIGARRRARALPQAPWSPPSRDPSAPDVPMGSADIPVQVQPDEETLAAKRREVLHALLEDLPEAQAETLLLRAVLDLSMEEVAEATGVPLNTVRSRLRLAKEALAKRISADPVLAETLVDR